MAAVSIWLFCVLWGLIILVAVIRALPTYRDDSQGAFGGPGDLLDYVLVNSLWIGVFGWLGREVWSGRKVLAAVGFFLPITLFLGILGLAMTLAGRLNRMELGIPMSVVLLLCGLLMSVFLLRAALARPS
jgi:hypothetical protein